MRIEVPVELPENVSPLAVPGGEQVFAEQFWSRGGTAKAAPGHYALRSQAPAPPPPAPGAVSETVEVTANAPMIDTESAQVTHNFDGQLLHPQAASGGYSTPSDKKQEQELLKSKLSAELLTLYKCSQRHATAVAGQACKVPSSGKISVEVKLSAGSAEIDQRLIAAGLAIKTGKGTATVTGEIAISQLQALVEVAEVQSVSKVD